VSQQGSTASAPTKILVVDDSASIRRQMCATLRAAGFVVLEASDGVEALDIVRVTTDIALIMLDLNMPRMDGLTFLDAMKSSELPPIKTVIVTVETQLSFIEKGKRAGAKGWLVKPVKPDHLVTVAKRLTTGATLTETGTSFVVPSK
jgi:two-component system chemotaxis response regulator CheY